MSYLIQYQTNLLLNCLPAFSFYFCLPFSLKVVSYILLKCFHSHSHCCFPTFSWLLFSLEKVFLILLKHSHSRLYYYFPIFSSFLLVFSLILFIHFHCHFHHYFPLYSAFSSYRHASNNSNHPSNSKV